MTQEFWFWRSSSGPASKFYFPDQQYWGGLEKADHLGRDLINCKPLPEEFYPTWLGVADHLDDIDVENFTSIGRRPPRRGRLFPLPALFHATCIQCANADAKSKMEEFNLGAARLHELELRSEIGTHEERAYWLDLAELHVCLVPEESDVVAAGSIEVPGRGELERWMRMAAHEPDYGVAISTPPNVDMWRDPTVAYGVFLTDALYQALTRVKGGHTKTFKKYFQRVKVLGG